MVTRQLQTERKTGSVHRPKTGILPTVLRNQPIVLYDYSLTSDPENLSAMSIDMMNTCAKFHRNLSIKYRDSMRVLIMMSISQLK